MPNPAGADTSVSAGWWAVTRRLFSRGRRTRSRRRRGAYSFVANGGIAARAASVDVMRRHSCGARGRDDDLARACELTSRALMTAAAATASGMGADAVRIGAVGGSLKHGVSELWLNGNLLRRLA